MKLERSPESLDVYQQLNRLLEDRQVTSEIIDLGARAYSARHSSMDMPDPHIPGFARMRE